jgi:hypothetical protein
MSRVAAATRFLELLKMTNVTWHIGLEGRSWHGAEMGPKHDALPTKLELIHGKLLWSEEERLVLLTALLEQVGLRRAVSLGDAALWRQAISELDQQ